MRLTTPARLQEAKLEVRLAVRGWIDLCQSKGFYVWPGMLESLYTIAEGVTQVQHIADEMEITQQAVGKSLKAMAAEGYVTIATSPIDRRAKVLTLTVRGHKVMALLHQSLKDRYA